MPRVSKVVLDASALLALLADEPGASEVAAIISDSMISSVNLAEVAGKLADYGMSDAKIRKALSIGVDIVNFTAEHAVATARLRRKTTALGLSLGDRACLATAMVAKVPALTVDAAWKKVKVQGVKVKLIHRKKT